MGVGWLTCCIVEIIFMPATMKRTTTKLVARLGNQPFIGIAYYDRWPLTIATDAKTDSPFLRLPLSGGGLTASISQSRATTSPLAGAGPHTCLGVGRIQLTCFWSRGCWLKLHNTHTHTHTKLQVTAYQTTRHSWSLYWPWKHGGYVYPGQKLLPLGCSSPFW